MIGETVDDLDVVVERSRVVHEVHVRKARANTEGVRCLVESAAEQPPVLIAVFECIRYVGSFLRSNALSEEELRGGIQRQAEEKRFQVDWGTPTGILGWNVVEQLFQVALIHVEVGDLAPGELGSQHRAGVCPATGVR
jgi:hypothetical protein